MVTRIDKHLRKVGWYSDWNVVIIVKQKKTIARMKVMQTMVFISMILYVVAYWNENSCDCNKPWGVKSLKKEWTRINNNKWMNTWCQMELELTRELIWKPLIPKYFPFFLAIFERNEWLNRKCISLEKQEHAFIPYKEENTVSWLFWNNFEFCNIKCHL